MIEGKRQHLRIGINGIFRGRPTGAPNYIINLVNHLGKLDEENEYYVFVTKSNRGYFDFSKDNMHEVLCRVKAESPLRRRIWEQTLFPGIVHALNLDVLHCPLNVVPVRVGCRVVVTFLDCQYFHPSLNLRFLRRTFHVLFMRMSLKKADAILTISQSMKEEIERYLGADTKSISVTHLGQDFSRCGCDRKDVDEIRTKLGLPDRYILFVGFPHFRKNLTGLVKGLALSQERLSERVDLILCGDIDTTIESDYPNIQRTIHELGVGDRVRFINYLETEDLQKVMAGADIFAFPSFYEGFGLPVIEAMACGTAVLVSDIAVMHEIVGEAGVLVDPYNAEDIARGICRLITDDELRAKLEIEGKRRAERFSWTNTALQTLACYQAVGNRCADD